MTTSSFPFLGFGMGLRTDHYTQILETDPSIDWFEVISENYMVDGGKPLYYLDTIRERFPMVMHGVSLSVGSTDPLDTSYLRALKNLANRINPPWFSDHLCWTGVHGKNMHDLLPLPYTKASVLHVADRIKQVQDLMGIPMLLENVSSYVTFKASQMTEWDFYRNIVEQADCGILLDVNNIYVSGFNHNFDPLDYLDALPGERIAQIHLAGHQNRGDIIIDTHDHPVIDSVWSLYLEALQRFGPISTMIERDDNIPPLDELVKELDQARMIAANLHHD